MVSTVPPLLASAPAWNSSPLAGVPSGSIVVSVAKMLARSGSTMSSPSPAPACENTFTPE